MEKLWDKIKKSVMDGMTTAAEKTEEYTKIGKVKLDVLSVKHKISRQFTELGGLVYDAVKEKKGADVLKTDEVKNIIATLNKLDEDLSGKEKELEEMSKKEKGNKKESK